MDLWKPALLAVVVLAGVLLFTPYEAILEGAIASAIVATVVVGFIMHPRREVFYVRTAVRLVDPDRNQTLEQDFLAVRVELVRLWLLFIPTFLAVTSLLFFATGEGTRFSYLNWALSSQYTFIALMVCQYAPLLVLILLAAWIDERRVLRNAEACSATSFSISRAPAGPLGRVSYAFRGEHGEYYGGDCPYFGSILPHELASIVFYSTRKPELNKIAIGFLFHRLIILERGVTDLDKQTVAAQTALAETAPQS